MARPRDLSKVFFKPVDDANTHFNFQQIDKELATFGPTARSQITNLIALNVGDNSIKIPGKMINAYGRITAYQDAPSNLYDKGPDGNGNWIVNASAACNVRFLFL